MIAETLPRTATTPDIETLVFRFRGKAPLSVEDYAQILRCYLRELTTAKIDFLTICDDGLLLSATDELLCKLVREGRLEKKPVVISQLHGTGISLLELKPPTPPTIAVFIIQLNMRETGLASLRHVDDERVALLPYNHEEAYFHHMISQGIAPPIALKLVHDTLCDRIDTVLPDQILTLGHRVKKLGETIGASFISRGISWE